LAKARVSSGKREKKGGRRGSWRSSARGEGKKTKVKEKRGGKGRPPYVRFWKKGGKREEKAAALVAREKGKIGWGKGEKRSFPLRRGRGEQDHQVSGNRGKRDILGGKKKAPETRFLERKQGRGKKKEWASIPNAMKEGRGEKKDKTRKKEEKMDELPPFISHREREKRERPKTSTARKITKEGLGRQLSPSKKKEEQRKADLVKEKSQGPRERGGKAGSH